MVKLDIIVPIYNVEKYLRKCLDSLVNQDYSDFFVRLINDGTKDSSLEIAQEYELKYPHLFKCYTKVNGGLSDARNYGIEQSECEFIAFIDSDDYLDHSMFSEMMNLIDDQTDIVCCDLMYVYDNGEMKVASCGDESLLKQKEDTLKLNNSACNKIFRRSLFDSIRFVKGKWYEDLATIPCVMYQARKIQLIHKPFYYYYQREGSIAHIKNEKMFDIYWAIQHIEECIQLTDWKDIKNDLLIEHGLFLTSLRIKKMDNFLDRKEFYRLNIQHLQKLCPNWYYLSIQSKYSIKSKIIFTLYKLNLFGLAAQIFKG